MRKTAKRNTVLTASLAALMGISSIGCKSMPSLAWWKTAKKDAPATAVVQAPALPSDVALKTEGLAAAPTIAPPTATSTTSSPGLAAPFAATAATGGTPSAYPSTGIPASYPNTAASAPSFTAAAPANRTSVAPSYAPAPGAGGSNLGSIAMPYNPNAVPPAATTAAAPAVTAPTADRYGAPAAPSFGTTNNVATNPVPTGSPSSRYGAPATPAPAPGFKPTVAAAAPSYTPAPIQAATASVSSLGATLASAVGDRYSQAVSIPASVPATPVTTAPAPTAPLAKTQPTTQTIADSQPYRPGGTSTYPGAMPEENNVEVAARPDVKTTTAPAPATTAPQAPRYW